MLVHESSLQNICVVVLTNLRCGAPAHKQHASHSCCSPLASFKRHLPSSLTTWPDSNHLICKSAGMLESARMLLLEIA